MILNILLRVMNCNYRDTNVPIFDKIIKLRFEYIIKKRPSNGRPLLANYLYSANASHNV